MWWILLLLITVGLVLFYSNNINIAPKQSSVLQEVNDSQIEEAKGKIQESEALLPYLQKSDMNTSKLEENLTAVIEENRTEVSELNTTIMSKIIEEIAPQVQNDIITIIPKRKVWIGMIELPSLKKINRVTTRQIKVDETKDWLIVFGHGQVNIQKDDKFLEFNKRGKLYFSYIDGKLKQIQKSEFKMHNQGRSW